MPKKRNLEPLWKLVAKWEGEKIRAQNLRAVSMDPFWNGARAFEAHVYEQCLQQLARALARLERKGKG